MAKDVDLSSREWTDLIFEGKNKDFGAYELRSGSVKRHNFAVIVVLSVLAIIIAFLIMLMTGVFERAEEDINANAGQEDVVISSEDIEEDVEDEDIPLDIPEPEEVQAEEDVTATQAVTEIMVVTEVDKEKEVKDVQEIIDNTAQLGAENHEGVEDIRKDIVKKEVVEEKPVEKPKDDAPVNIAMVEQKPMFPGGEAAMYKWLSENMSYPAAASEEGISGKVYVQFVVEKDGRITGVHVVRGKHPALDAEAKRVVSKMPKWTPGRNNGQPVRVTYNLPVNFQLKQ